MGERSAADAAFLDDSFRILPRGKARQREETLGIL